MVGIRFAGLNRDPLHSPKAANPSCAAIDHGEQAAINTVPDIHKAVMESDDMKEGIQSFIERREAVFKGR